MICMARLTRVFGTLAGAGALALGSATPAPALPVFAHRYGLSCQVCHTTVPQLTPFGERFLRNGFRIPGATENRIVPIALRMNLAYSSEPDPRGLPKAIVDEAELLTGGHIGTRVWSWIESYVVDGGEPGLARDVWMRYDFAHDGDTRGAPFALRAGQFTLPLPVDPETSRETENHYALFDQTVGANPFDLFAPRIGIEATLGRPTGPELTLAGLKGHDPQSGLRSDGTDVMVVAAERIPGVEFSAYRYAGTRPLGASGDAFWRQGYGIGGTAGRLTLTAVLQQGGDGDPLGTGRALRSSGGFFQSRWAFSPGLTLVARYDGTSQPGSMTRSATVALVRRIGRNAKLTVEDVLATSKQTLNAGFLFAY